MNLSFNSISAILCRLGCENFSEANTRHIELHILLGFFVSNAGALISSLDSSLTLLLFLFLLFNDNVRLREIMLLCMFVNARLIYHNSAIDQCYAALSNYFLCLP